MAKPSRKKTDIAPKHAPKLSFGDWWRSFWQDLRWVIAAFVIGRVVMWICYPDPLMTTDTGEFVNSAMTLRHNPYKPIGYSIFLAVANGIVSGTTAVIFFQFVLRFMATLVLLSVLRKYWKVAQGTLVTLGVLLSVEPMALVADHSLLSDSLFWSMGFLVFAAILRYIKQPSATVAFWIWLSLALAMLVRHNGLFLFAIAITAILLLRSKDMWFHAAIVTIGFVLVVLTIMWRFKEDQGRFELTAFDGWAFYGGIAHRIDRDPNYYEKLNPELRDIYRFFATAPDSIYNPPHTDAWYRWAPQSPAKQYLFQYLKKNPGISYHRAFVETNEALRKLTHDMILHRPVDFLMHFYLPNLGRSVYPHDVADLDTRQFNYNGQKHESILAFYQEDTSAWRARFYLWGAVSYLLPAWVLFWWLAAAWGLFQSWRERHGQPLLSWLTSDLRALVMVMTIFLGLITALSHYFYLRYALPNLPLLMIVGTLALAPFIEKWWTRRDEDVLQED